MVETECIALGSRSLRCPEGLELALGTRDVSTMSNPTTAGLRLPWLLLGLGCVAVGAIGVVVPGLPTTVFFIGAAACFGRSSDRLERWVMQLPGIGPAVKDFRYGLGMPRRAKAFAVASIVVFSSLGTVVLVEGAVTSAAIILAAAVGVIYILARVPTRERIVAGSDKDSRSDDLDRF